MRLFPALLWRKPRSEPIPFQPILLPMKLRATVSGKGDKTTEVCCIQEMSVMMACLKLNEYNESMCPKEIESFQKCYKNTVHEKKVKKEHSQKGILTPGEKRLTFKQVNILLKRHPDIE